MKKRKTTEEFAKEIQELTDGLFQLEGSYKNKETITQVKCLICNQIFDIRPTTFLDELKCKCCGIKIDLFERYNINTLEDYINYIKSKTNEYEIIDTVLVKNNNIKILHKKCGIEQYINSRRFIRNQICKHCDGGQPVDYYGFIKKVASIYGTEYVVLNRNKNDFEFLHTPCKTKFTMKSGVFLKHNSPCPVCLKNTVWDLKRVKKEIYEKTNGEFICVDDNYKTVDTPLKIFHNECKKTFEMSVNSFLKCPKCRVCENNYSLGEKYIKNVLNEFNLKFEKEYTFGDCKRKNELRFDFAIFDVNYELACLIEFDGEEHYIPIFDDNIDIMMQTKERDQIKNEYCKTNNIILIRIPFWEKDNIRKILIQSFKKYGIRYK